MNCIYPKCIENHPDLPDDLRELIASIPIRYPPPHAVNGYATVGEVTPLPRVIFRVSWLAAHFPRLFEAKMRIRHALAALRGNDNECM